MNAQPGSREKTRRHTYAEKIVSDHALVRWCERAQGLDMTGLRRRLADQLPGAIEAGATAVVIDGMTFVIRDGQCVTALEGRKVDRGD